MNSEAVSGKPKSNKHRGGYLKNPKLARKDEVIGGGFWVFRRCDDTGRIRPSMWPFEYDSADAASEQAAKLARDNPGETFIVVEQQDGFVFEQAEAA